ncbi:MAG TPA: DUF3159 domain-containing protein [Aeromicrobium sp.]|nr:DUF3159 domain-containing protein [Aeromicrobium sp.]
MPDPSPETFRAASQETVEQLVRTKLAEALGGRRGIIESAIPTLAFTLLYVTTHDLRLALTVSIGVTVGLLIVRVLQRSTVQFVLNALFGIAIAAVFAARSGEARDVFLPGILYNAGYAALFVFSIVVRWPIVGFMIGSLTGEPTEWHRDRALVKLCSRLTWLFALPCIVRVLVQYPLYAGDHVALLGTSKIFLGWPLQIAAFGAMAWLLSRDRTPVES